MKIALILDKSGSMQSCRDTTISAVNEYFDDLRANDTDARFYITLFDTELEQMVDGVALAAVPRFNRENYRPQGCTALLDAVGSTVARIENRLDDDERVLVVIMTDGHENSSVEYTHRQIQQLIRQKQAQGNWTFVFLSESLDAWDVGARMGVAAGNTAVFQKENMHRAMKFLSEDTCAYMIDNEESTVDFMRGKKAYTEDEVS